MSQKLTNSDMYRLRLGSADTCRVAYRIGLTLSPGGFASNLASFPEEALTNMSAFCLPTVRCPLSRQSRRSYCSGANIANNESAGWETSNSQFYLDCDRIGSVLIAKRQLRLWAFSATGHPEPLGRAQYLARLRPTPTMRSAEIPAEVCCDCISCCAPPQPILPIKIKILICIWVRASGAGTG